VGTLKNMTTSSIMSTFSTLPPIPVPATTGPGIKRQLGFGLGVSIGARASLLVGLYLWRRKLRKKHRSSGQEIDSADKAEMEAH